jgi:hypothetical protein
VIEMIMFNPRSKRAKRAQRDRADAIDRVISEVLKWPGVTMAPHQFDAVEFQLDGVEFGHLDRGGVLGVPFVRRIRNALVDRGEAVVNRWVPNSGWVAYKLSSDTDADHALRLLRLSYLYRTIAVGDGAGASVDDLRRELDALRLPRRIADLFESLIAHRLEEATSDS